ncbi:hyaluronan mediated motility receptor [Corythoichthys intestinalis]|uniref:hyaluronan mediated motility receptor n=1 Tax=Corythoichthys intestinalis TaxID=161448 RepID=UPI0025A5FF02|nr:hyaluronan mediated motility receptor [Corythoichthys intestinalis]XP_061793250.1 hyaluronan mediated motility receptor-like [Nerophis lumbriciformis]
MSFSRAPLKRFNEAVGCAPAPGIYDIKAEEPKGPASFERSDRFKHSKAVPPSSPSGVTLMSPVRRTISFDGLVDRPNTRKKEHSMTLKMKQHQLLEKEIRLLVQQRGEQDRRIFFLEEDLKKAEAKLLAAVREKTCLTANITSHERQIAELKKVNELLKNKVSADTTKKKINSLTMELIEARNKLDCKNKEFSVLQLNADAHLKVLEMDLSATKDAVKSLTDRNNDLEALHQMMKTQNDELEQQNDRLLAEIIELKAEVKVVQGYLDSANDQIQELRLKLQDKAQQDILCNADQQNTKDLEEKLEQCNIKLEFTELALRQKEEEVLKYQHAMQCSKEDFLEADRNLKSRELELKASQKSVDDLETQMKFINQEVQDSQATISQQLTELALLQQVLQKTEREMDEKVANLEQKCMNSAEEKNKIQEDASKRVEELTTELKLLKDANRDEEEKQIQLQKKHDSVIEELMKERALVDSLTVILEQQRQESEECRNQLNEELEEVLGELALMEEQEQRRGEAKDQGQKEVVMLKRQLSETRELLEHKSNEISLLKDGHSSIMRELQEAYTSSLEKTEEMSKELESTKEALSKADESREKMKEEMERLIQQMKEESDNVIQQMRLENARVLQETQACLSQKNQEMQIMEESHAMKICLLEQELQRQTKDNENALMQEEAQKEAQLRYREEMAQKQLEEVCQEKVNIMEQLLQEKEDKIKYQAELEVERAALAAETQDIQNLKSDVFRLQTELNRLSEERIQLLSQIELSDQSNLAYKHQVEVVDTERKQVQSHFDELQSEYMNLRAQRALMEEKVEGLLNQIEDQQQERCALQHQIDTLTQEKVTLHWAIDEQQKKVQEQMIDAQDKKSNSETEHWRTKYEELLAKIKPFEEQLNNFAAERNALLNLNGANQEELNKLSDAYAHLLGHQNQKQKIKHVIKLKDENFNLKQEVMKLRSQLSRQKSDLSTLKSKLPDNSQRKFDPSKAFQHNKENRRTEAAPALKQENPTAKKFF